MNNEQLQSAKDEAAREIGYRPLIFQPPHLNDFIDRAMEIYAEKVNNTVDKQRKKYMREQANSIFELTKGFTSEPTSNAMKSALEMAGYVQELTN